MINYILGGSLFLNVILIFMVLSKPKKPSFIIVEKYSEYMGVLQYILDKAYMIIHKTELVTFSLEGYRPDGPELQKAMVNYIDLAKKFLGPNLIESFIMFFGDEHTFYFNLMEYFHNRFENDEIRNTTISNMMKDEDDVDVAIKT